MSANKANSAIQQPQLDFEYHSELSPGFPNRLVILDCETTGGKPTYHQIIEIALLVVTDGKITETWETLIKPSQRIPEHIETLTGISQNMVSNAPTFANVADLLLSKLNDHTLVAHNARFDYGFLKNEFARLGINYSTKPLCSVKFSRQLYPQYKRHSLDQIIKRFQLNVHHRHRAFDDAKAIYDFFLQASQTFNEQDITAVCDDITDNANLPAKLNPGIINALPKQAGVYYFHDEHGKLLYIGKSVNIRNRVLSHFSQDYKNHKDLKMSSRIADVSYETTISDFSAQLRESQEIKKHRPPYNQRLRKIKKLYQLMVTTNSAGYAVPTVKTQQVSDDLKTHFGLFRSYYQIQSRLKKLADDYQLCFKLLGIEGKNTESDKACFRHQLKKCPGACCQQESVEDYNIRLYQALHEYQCKVWPWPDAILLQETNNKQQYGYHLIKDWIYPGQLDTPDSLYDLGYQLSTSSDIVSDEPWQTTPSPQFESEQSQDFDLDTYFILIRFLLNPERMRQHQLSIHPLIAINIE